MEIDLKVAVDKDSADYRRMESNSLWRYIREDIEDLYIGGFNTYSQRKTNA